MIYITGDIHGQITPLDELVMTYSPTSNDTIVILGDVGVNYYGNNKDLSLKKQMQRIGCTIFCIHGNHENRPQNIASYKQKEWNGGRVFYEDEFPNILFPVDGDIFDIEGKKCIVIGGAYSVDKFYRLMRNWHWWADEQPSAETKRYVENQTAEHDIDIVFTHTCPYKYIPTECFLSDIDQSKVDGSTERWLDSIEDRTDYKAWYCGHWHTNKDVDKIHFLFHDVKTI